MKLLMGLFPYLEKSLPKQPYLIWPKIGRMPIFGAKWCGFFLGTFSSTHLIIIVEKKKRKEKNPVKIGPKFGRKNQPNLGTL